MTRFCGLSSCLCSEPVRVTSSATMQVPQYLHGGMMRSQAANKSDSLVNLCSPPVFLAVWLCTTTLPAICTLMCVAALRRLAGPTGFVVSRAGTALKGAP